MKIWGTGQAWTVSAEGPAISSGKVGRSILRVFFQELY